MTVGVEDEQMVEEEIGANEIGTNLGKNIEDETGIIEAATLEGVTDIKLDTTSGGSKIIEGAIVPDTAIDYKRNIAYLKNNGFDNVEEGTLDGGRHKWVQKKTGDIIILEKNNRFLYKWRNSFTIGENICGTKEEIDLKLKEWDLIKTQSGPKGYIRYLTHAGKNYVDFVIHNKSDGIAYHVIGFGENNKGY